VPEFDLIIRGGLIVDGSGREPFEGDVGITGSTITGLGAD
jgi:N-acyl-D-amino-acid deacylase